MMGLVLVFSARGKGVGGGGPGSGGGGGRAASIRNPGRRARGGLIDERPPRER